MIVGIDVHKKSHAAALVDERGAPIATLTITNSREGVARLRRWLSEHGAEEAVVGIENAGGYGRLVCTALAAAGHEVLNVPAWRVKRERVHEGPGKSDPADAIAIALCVGRHREKLGPALEPPLIRAIALLDTHRRQSVTRRTDGIQRLRAVWAQVDPEAEAAVPNIAARRVLHHLKELDLGDGLAERAAARCIHDLACEIEALNERVAQLERQLSELLAESGDPFEDVPGVGLATTVILIAESGDVRRFRSHAAYARYGGLGPDPLRLGRHRRPTPSPPWRQPPGERLPPPHRRHAGSRRPPGPRLPRPQDRRGQDEARSPPSPQAAPLRPRLPAPPHLGRGNAPAAPDLT
jgi:transposase